MPKQNIPFSKRTRDHGMKAVHSYFADNPRSTGFVPSALYDYKLRKSINAERLVHVLGGLGYLEYDLDAANGHHNVRLTDRGICYFEQRRDDRLQFWVNSIIVPIFVALAVSALSSVIFAEHKSTSDSTLHMTQAPILSPETTPTPTSDLPESTSALPTPTLEATPTTSQESF